MYLTRNHQDFRGQFLFHFLCVARRKGETEEEKGCLCLITGYLGLSTGPFLGFTGAPQSWSFLGLAGLGQV